MTDEKLVGKEQIHKYSSDRLKLFGTLSFMIWYEFSLRRSLWDETTSYKYVRAQNFCCIMTYSRFEAIWSCTRFSMWHDDDIFRQNRWILINGFVEEINEHRPSQVAPSYLICVDEILCRLYGLGWEWLDVGLPRAINRKPENICEIKTSACGR